MSQVGAGLVARLRSEAMRQGFSSVGVAHPDRSPHLSHYRAWLSRGFHGEMSYLARDDATQRRGDLAATLEGVRSVVVVTHAYGQPDPPGVPDDPSRAVIARYARGRDYHRVVKKKLTALGRWLDAEAGAGKRDGVGAVPSVGWRAYVDTGPILERDLGQRAGLGWFGKNTMLIDPKRGSYFFLGVLLTDLELPADEPFKADRCGSCTACLDACPTDALLGRDENGAPVMDATKCISYLTIEHRGAIPEELRPLMGNRVFGCDICQEVCPWNQRFAEVAAESDYVARQTREIPAEAGAADVGPAVAVIPTTDGPALVDLMRMSEGEWDAYTRGSAMRRAGYPGLRRNVAIALGNRLARGDSPDPDAVGELVEARSDEDPIVAEAAAWGLARVAST